VSTHLHIYFEGPCLSNSWFSRLLDCRLDFALSVSAIHFDFALLVSAIHLGFALSMLSLLAMVYHCMVARDLVAICQKMVSLCYKIFEI
jgi:hypothetical protein